MTFLDIKIEIQRLACIEDISNYIYTRCTIVRIVREHTRMTSVPTGILLAPTYTHIHNYHALGQVKKKKKKD